MVLVVLFVPIAFILLNVESLLVNLGQDPQASYYAQIYVNYFIPGLFLCQFDNVQRVFLNSLSYTYIPLIAETIGFFLHIVFNYVFVVRLGLGIKGTAFSDTATYGVCLAINFIYSGLIPKIAPAIQWPKWSAFQGWKDHFKLALPCAGMSVLDGCATHLMTFTTGLLGVSEQAGHLIGLNIAVVFYMFAVGL